MSGSCGKKQIKKWGGWLCPLAGMGMALLVAWPVSGVWTALLWLAALALALWGAHGFFQQTDHRFQVCFGVLGALFAQALALGLCLSVHGQTGWKNLALCLGAALCLGPAAGQGFGLLVRLLEKGQKTVRLSPGRAFWLCFGVLAVCWLPVYLALFPGMVCQDFLWQLDQMRTGRYTTHHPLAHTLLVQGCMALFGEGGGFAVYIGLQTLTLAAAMARAMSWLAGTSCRRWQWTALLVCFALAPQNIQVALLSTKDAFFSAFFLLLFVECCRWSAHPKWTDWLRLTLLAALAGLFRNNALYALAAALLALTVIALRRVNRRLLAALLAGVLLCGCANAGLQAVTHAESTTAAREHLSIPCQQLARAYPLMDENTAWEVRQAMPLVEQYVPWLSDPVKSVLNVGRADRLATFLKLWGREAFHYPIAYIDAFLYTTRGYWDLSDLSFATIYNYQGGTQGVMHIYQLDTDAIRAHSLLPGLKALLQRLFVDNQWLSLPLVWRVLHPAVYTWLLLLCLAWMVWKRRWAFLPGGVAALMYLATLLLGPCCLVRYQFDLMLIAPVMACALAAPQKPLTREEHSV